jgi:hypothetical protein
VSQHAKLKDGTIIAKGAKVQVRRQGWFGKAGVYTGRASDKRLMVEFEENGGTVLLCSPNEVAAIEVDG